MLSYIAKTSSKLFAPERTNYPTSTCQLSFILLSVDQGQLYSSWCQTWLVHAHLPLPLPSLKSRSDPDWSSGRCHDHDERKESDWQAVQHQSSKKARPSLGMGLLGWCGFHIICIDATINFVEHQLNMSQAWRSIILYMQTFCLTSSEWKVAMFMS